MKDESPIKLREVVLGKNHEWNGCEIRELDISRRTYIVMVRRRGTMLVPHGSLRLEQGDVVILYSKDLLAQGDRLKL